MQDLIRPVHRASTASGIPFDVKQKADEVLALVKDTVGGVILAEVRDISVFSTCAITDHVIEMSIGLYVLSRIFVAITITALIAYSSALVYDCVWNWSLCVEFQIWRY